MPRLPGRKKSGTRSDKELLKEFKERLASSEKHMQPIMERVERARLVAKGKTSPDFGKERDPRDPRDWRSRSFPAVAREKWELKCAELTVERPRADFDSYDPEYADNELLAEDAVGYHYERDRFDQTYRLAMRAATRDGGAVIRTSWETRYAPKYVLGEPVLDDNGKPVLEPIHSGATNRMIRLEDTFPDPTANTFRDAAWAIIRSRATIEDLEQQRTGDGKSFYRESALKELRKMQSNSGSDQNDKKRDDETQEAYDARRRGVHTIHEMMTPYSRLIVANRSTIIRHDPVWPQKCGNIPLTMIRTIEDEDCIVGETMLLLIDDLQQLYWHFLNGLADAVSLAINPPQIADVEEDPKAADQVLYPGVVLNARGGQQTLKIMQDVAQISKYDSFQILSLILDLMDRISGMNAALAGVSNAATATEAAINVRQGKGRIGYEMIVSDDAWCEVARKTYAAIQQYQSDAVTAKIAGRQYDFRPEQLTDMMLTPSQSVDERTLKDLERQDMQALWEIVKETVSDPSMLPSVDATKALQRLYRSFGGDPHDVRPPAPMPQLPPAGMMDTAGGADLLDENGNPLDEASIEAELPNPDTNRPSPQQVANG